MPITHIAAVGLGLTVVHLYGYVTVSGNQKFYIYTGNYSVRVFIIILIVYDLGSSENIVQIIICR